MREKIIKNNKTADVSNNYQLDGRVPIAKAIPFGLRHILAMFVMAVVLNLILPKEKE